MNLISYPAKPRFNSRLPLLCQFSLEKAYLWSLIRDKLQLLANNKSSQLNALDAACHSLITRGMFPSNINYFGLDISVNRLKLAYKKKRVDDILYLGDLTLPLGLSSCFDIVVSCNTLSHLPSVHLLDALRNLIISVKSGGHLILNIGLSRDFQSVTNLLLDSFESVETVFVGTKPTRELDSQKNFSPEHIPSLISTHEESAPNNACLHYQVLFHASNKNGSIDVNPAPGKPSKILRLNNIPTSNIIKCESDSDLISYVHNSDSFDLILLSDHLFNSAAGHSIVSSITSASSNVFSITSENIPYAPHQKILLLGFEMSWVGDQAQTRLTVNTIRRIPGVSLNFILVQRRSGLHCRPSLILDDL